MSEQTPGSRGHVGRGIWEDQRQRAAVPIAVNLLLENI